ncbi:hypothetical protein Tco_0230256, partial [Tanacetum coccineum]
VRNNSSVDIEKSREDPRNFHNKAHQRSIYHIEKSHDDPYNGYNKDTVEDLVKFVGTHHSFDCSMVPGLELAVYNSDHNEHRSHITYKSMSDTGVVEYSRKSLENY